MILRELFVRLGLDVNAASFATGEVAAKVVEKGFEKLKDVVTDAIEEFVNMVKEVAKTGAELEELSQQTGITTDSLQNLITAANYSGVSTEALTQSIGLLSRNMFAVKQGSEEAAKSFASIGVKVTDAHGKLRGADDVIGDVADKFKKLPDGVQKTALAMRLFGRAGKEMIPFLNEGKEGIKELAATTDNLTEEQIAAGKEIVRQQKIRAAQTTSFWQQVIGTILPDLAKIETQSTKTRKAVLDFAKPIAVKAIKLLIGAFHGLQKVVKGIVGTIKFFARNWQTLVGYVGIFSLALIAHNAALIASYLRVAAVATWTAIRTAASWALAAAPFVVMAAIVTAIALAFDDLRVYAEGGDSLIGRYIGKIKEWMKIKPDDSPFLKALKWTVQQLEKILELIDQANAAFGRVDPATIDRKSAQSAGAKRSASDVQTEATARKRVAMGKELTQAEKDALARGGVSPEAFVAKYGQQSPQAPSYSPASSGTSAGPYAAGGVVQNNQIVINAQPGMTADDLGPVVQDALTAHLDQINEETNASIPAYP